jgi:GGDEF domain-containing protein
VLARLGGDEFAVIVPTFVSRAALEASALRLARPSASHTRRGHRVCTNVSIGIAIGPGDGGASTIS